MNQKEFIKSRLGTYSEKKTYSEFIGWAFNALCNKLKSEGFFIDENSDYEDLYARLPGSKAIVKFTFDPSYCKWTYIYMGGADEGGKLKKAVESIDLTTPEMKGDVPTELRTYSKVTEFIDVPNPPFKSVDEFDEELEIAGLNPSELTKAKDFIKNNLKMPAVRLIDGEVNWNGRTFMDRLGANQVHNSIEFEGNPSIKIDDLGYGCIRVTVVEDGITNVAFYVPEDYEPAGKYFSKVNSYSGWSFVFKALGGAVIGQLVAKAFNRAKFKQPSNKELFDATLKKFEKAKTPEDAEKYYKMLIGQLNDSENKEEVKQYISEVKEEAESNL